MVIVDSSVAFKWFTSEEPFTEEALAYLDQHLKKINPILAPSLIFYELTNAWSCNGKLTLDQVSDNLNQLKKHNLAVVEIGFPLLKKAAKLSKTYKISVYDASYIALAQKKKCDFVTADEKLVKRVNLPFVKTL